MTKEERKVFDDEFRGLLLEGYAELARSDPRNKDAIAMVTAGKAMLGQMRRGQDLLDRFQKAIEGAKK